jgi:hypothetical protein
MSNNNIWYGFLEAGNKSSPVVRDLSLQTNNPETVYLYNLVRGIFLEYSLEIVQPKLRDLKPGDISLDELDHAFQLARQAFNNGKVVDKVITTAPATAMVAAAAIEDNEDDDIELDVNDWDDLPDDDGQAMYT